MRSIVTGGAGFIGSNLVDALLERGDQVTVLDNLSTGKRENLNAATAAGAGLHVVDIRDAAAVDAVFQQARPQVVFHMAAQIDIRVAVGDPALDASINVLGTIAVLEAARRIDTAAGALYATQEMARSANDDDVEKLLVEASIATAQAKIITTRAALHAAERLFEVGGASAAATRFNLDRHWRNARTHTLHSPVAYKAEEVGRLFLRGEIPSPSDYR